MMALVEVSLMPGEVVLRHGDMARELSFAVRGVLVVTDAKGTLIELLSGEGTAPCVVGTVSFFLGAVLALGPHNWPAVPSWHCATSP